MTGWSKLPKLVSNYQPGSRGLPTPLSQKQLLQPVNISFSQHTDLISSTQQLRMLPKLKCRQQQGYSSQLIGRTCVVQARWWHVTGDNTNTDNKA